LPSGEWGEASKDSESDKTGPKIQLSRGATYTIRVLFGPVGATSEPGARPVRLPIRIAHGIQAPRVPLQIVVDSGFLESPLQVRDIEIPADARSPAEEFEITVPQMAPEKEEIVARKLKVLVYQQGVPCGTLAFPVGLL